MELWVRSQNKELLIKTPEGGYRILGVYKSKERAIEILDEMQNSLQPTIEYKPIVQEEYNPSYKYKHFVKVDDNVEIKELSTFVYQMPKE